MKYLFENVPFAIGIRPICSTLRNEPLIFGHSRFHRLLSFGIFSILESKIRPRRDIWIKYR